MPQADDVHPVHQVQLFRGHVQLVDGNGAAVQPARQGVADHPRLLVDLFQHEIRVAALFGGVHVPVDVGDRRVHGVAGRVEEIHPVGAQASHLPVGEHHHIAGGVYHGDDVGGHVAPLGPHPHHNGGILAGDGDGARFAVAHHRNAVGAHQAPRRHG